MHKGRRHWLLQDAIGAAITCLPSHCEPLRNAYREAVPLCELLDWRRRDPANCAPVSATLATAIDMLNLSRPVRSHLLQWLKTATTCTGKEPDH